MPLVDLTMEELIAYKPKLTRRDDFLKFWDENKKQAEEQTLNYVEKRIEYFSSKLEVFKVAYDGFLDKSPIIGYFIKKAETKNKNPVIVFFHGYGGNKGTVSDYLGWIMLGFSVFTVDLRGQAGESPDYARYTSGSIIGNMTKGILNKETYYYRYVYMDSFRAINYVLTRDDVDENKIGVAGVSQGGGLAIAMAALHKKVSLSLSSVPYLCNFERAINVASAGPYLEILNYIKAHPEQEKTVMGVLSYFDNMNLAPEVKVPILISVGLVDTICPPSTIFATYQY
ncbi:MAG: acetylxylan esterase, partial [Candidatus Brockarchaeota archaeon]|nr:acetylxylan esterase [Candidatus Brockarchaeota archaeon]